VPARRILIAVGWAVSLALGSSLALAADASGPPLGAYTGLIALGGGGHLAITIKVDSPSTTGSVEADCGAPRGNHTVTDAWDSRILQLNAGNFSFAHKAKIHVLTTKPTGALIGKSRRKALVQFSGVYANDQYTGTVTIAGSPCAATAYTATLLAGPAPG